MDETETGSANFFWSRPAGGGWPRPASLELDITPVIVHRLERTVLETARLQAKDVAHDLAKVTRNRGVVTDSGLCGGEKLDLREFVRQS